MWAGYGCGALVTYLPSPAPWWLDVAGLAFPYMFFLMLICIVIWLTRRWQLALISVCILLCGWKGIIHTWGWHWRNEAVSAEEGFTLMSFNVNDFKSMASSWPHWREDFDHILYFHNADIICLQEFATTDLYSQDEKTMCCIIPPCSKTLCLFHQRFSMAHPVWLHLVFWKHHPVEISICRYRKTIFRP